jgi:hypothetical protein
MNMHYGWVMVGIGALMTCVAAGATRIPVDADTSKRVMHAMLKMRKLAH